MNLLKNNPLRTRDDFASSVVQLWEPLKPYFSPGCSRVDLATTGAHFTKSAAELEGFARPLFGLAPLAKGDLPFADWQMLRDGYINGCDPTHSEFWGEPYDYDQRLVESAALGFGLLFAKDQLWDPLTQIQKDNVAAWLDSTLHRKVADNNWHFFHVFASLALEHVGVEHDLSIRETALQRLESFYIADGWYADGEGRRFDHYIPFAMHLYGLIYSVFATEDESRCQRFRDRAAEFAVEFQHWFDTDGASLAYGRSMTYRFAQASFWGALAFAGVEALPWGQIKGLWARNLRWWGKRDWYDRDGVMSVGYAYPNLLMSESYNSPGSPYWAMKAYLPLALPADHPFWLVQEQEKCTPDAKYSNRVTGTIGFAAGDNRVMLSGCSEMRMIQRCGAEKYGRFAYSTSFGFSVDINAQGFLVNPFDNMLAVSEDGVSFHIRSDIEACHVGSDWLYSLWRPTPDIEIETWLLERAPWHVRAHKISTSKPFFLTEGGFAIERKDEQPVLLEGHNGHAQIVTNEAHTHAIDLSPVTRNANARQPVPNSSLYFPRTYVPHLFCQLSVGTSWQIGAYAAGTNPVDTQDWLDTVPMAPDISWLESLKSSDNAALGMKFREPDPISRFL